MLKLLRLSDNSLDGSTDEIASDVKEGGSRIPSVSEKGTESSAGTLNSEWNLDEQDELIASVMGGEWEEDEDEETGNVTLYQTLVMGDGSKDASKDKYHVVKVFPQTPTEYEHFTNVQVNSLSIESPLNSFVKLAFELMGGNDPLSVTVDPIDSTKFEYGTGMNTKSLKTLEGKLSYKDAPNSFTGMTEIIQSPNFSLSINNNKDRADGLFQTEAIEMSDGDFVVEGSFDVWKADAIGYELRNKAKQNADISLEYEASRTVSGEKTTYKIQIQAHLRQPSRSKDGNRYKESIPFSVNVLNGIKFIKIVETV